MQIAAIAAVGAAEGVKHVNWQKVTETLVWWVAGFMLVQVAAAAFVAQGRHLSTTVWKGLVSDIVTCDERSTDMCLHVMEAMPI